MNTKQIIGMLGAIITIVGCFLPIATVPIIGGINYMFPPGHSIGDGVFVAGIAVFGLIAALAGSSGGLLIASILGGLVFGNTVANFSDILQSSEDEGGLAGAFISTISLGPGAAAIAVGLVLMFVASFLPKPAPTIDDTKKMRCPSCAELIQAQARKCRFCGEVLERIPPSLEIHSPSNKDAAEDNKAAEDAVEPRQTE